MIPELSIEKSRTRLIYEGPLGCAGVRPFPPHWLQDGYKFRIYEDTTVGGYCGRLAAFGFLPESVCFELEFFFAAFVFRVAAAFFAAFDLFARSTFFLSSRHLSSFSIAAIADISKRLNPSMPEDSSSVVARASVILDPVARERLSL